jgi:acetylornithine deacetylase
MNPNGTADPDVKEAASEAWGLINPIREQVFDLLQKLVRTESVSIPPDGREVFAQRVLRDELHRHGLDAQLYATDFLERSGHPLVRRERKYRDRPNLIASVQGSGGGKSLLLSGHIDTVPAGRGSWAEPPFSGTLRDGKLFGRGSWDMKGGLSALFAVLIALERSKRKLAGDLLAESVVDEEWAGGGGTLAARLKGISADACVIAEGTNLHVVRATRGGFFLDIIAEAGDPSAYFSRDAVVSPAIPLGRLLGWVDAWRGRRAEVDRGEAYRDFPDPAPVQVLAVEANRFDSDIPWSTPLEARLRVYFQFLPQEDQIGVIGQIRESFDDFCRNDPFFRLFPPRWKPVVDPPLVGHELPFTHPWTQCLATASAAALNRPAVVTAAEYPCDAFINQLEFGIPTLLFGPCGAGAHNVDEYVLLDSVLQTSAVFLTAAILWCG